MEARLDEEPTLPLDVDWAEGLLVVGRRRSWCGRVMAVSADAAATHSAITALLGDVPSVIEVGPHGVFSRTWADFRAAYDEVGIGRLRMSAVCTELVVDRAKLELDAQRLAYSWDACALVEAASLVRRFAPATIEEWIVRRASQLAERFCSGANASGVTCSGFVVRCLSTACAACRPRLQIPARQRTPWWRRAATARSVGPSSTRRPCADLGVAEVLTMPADLWVSDVVGRRHLAAREGPWVTLPAPQTAPRERCVAVCS